MSKYKFKKCYPSEPIPTILYSVDADGNENTLPLTPSANESLILKREWDSLVKNYI